jgi:hypothetical protein
MYYNMLQYLNLTEHFARLSHFGFCQCKYVVGNVCTVIYNWQLYFIIFDPNCKLKYRVTYIYVKGKPILIQAWIGPYGSRRLRLPDNRQMKMARLSALRTDRRYPQEITLVFISVTGHSATGRIKSMKNPNDLIGNLNHDLSACGAVPQPTAPQCIYIYIHM